MEELNVVVYATGDYKILALSVLGPSLPPDIKKEKVQIITGDLKTLVGQTKDAEYKEQMLNRLIYYQQYIRSHQGEKVLFLDCDVVFLQPIKEEILHFLDEHDFAMQKNFIAGIWGINCNERSLKFFDNFIEHLQQIPPPDRQDGFPQFELGDKIVEFRDAMKLKVLELPEEYGFLTHNTKIYHAINGGESVFSKFCVLKAAASVCQSDSFAGLTSDAFQKEAFNRNEKTLAWLGCFKGEAVKDAIQTGRMPAGFPEKFAIPEDFRTVMNLAETVEMYCGFSPSWLDETYINSPSWNRPGADSSSAGRVLDVALWVPLMSVFNTDARIKKIEQATVEQWFEVE